MYGIIVRTVVTQSIDKRYSSSWSWSSSLSPPVKVRLLVLLNQKKYYIELNNIYFFFAFIFFFFTTKRVFLHNFEHMGKNEKVPKIILSTQPSSPTWTKHT